MTPSSFVVEDLLRRDRREGCRERDRQCCEHPSIHPASSVRLKPDTTLAGIWTSDRAVESVAEVAQARDDELVGVELLVHDRREDGDVRDGRVRGATRLLEPTRYRSC